LPFILVPAYGKLQHVTAVNAIEHGAGTPYDDQANDHGNHDLN
jgi:hypothetical protein